jgi:GT2 family glycosyltransferase
MSPARTQETWVHSGTSNVALSVEPREKIAVIIVGHNEAAWIRACLESVVKEVSPNSIFYVDNASSDGTVNIVRRYFSGVQVLANSKNRGFAAGNNQVLRAILATGSHQYVFLLNPDTVLPADLIETLHDFMAGHPEYAVVGPLQIEYDGTMFSTSLNRVSRRDVAIGQYHILRRWLPEVTLRVTNEHPPGILGVYYVQGSAFFIKVEVLRAIGLFDELFHSFYEEVDLCRRALWSGYKLGLLTTLRLPHASRGPGSRSRWRLYLRFRNKYLFALTDPNIAIRWLPTVVLRLVLSDLRQAAHSHEGADMSVTSTARAILWMLRCVPQIVRARDWRSRMAKDERSGILVGRWVHGRAHLF